jgi:protein gp37
VPDAFIDRVCAVMALAPQHTFQILTKRAERMRDYVTGLMSRAMEVPARGDRVGIPYDIDRIGALLSAAIGRRVDTVWPLPNVWLGVSVENQRFADERIPLLLQTPAAVRFISAEPLLGPVDIAYWLTCDACGHPWRFHTAGGMCQGTAKGIECYCVMPREASLDWVIVGGESGQGARPFDLSWARSIVAQCKAAGVPVFVKQLGANAQDADGSMHGRYSAGGIKHDFPKLLNRKGGDPSEWPEDLRVREFPEVRL